MQTIQNNNLTDVSDDYDLTDGDDDMNKFEQEIHRDQPNRAARRHVERMRALLMEEAKDRKPTKIIQPL